MNFTFVNRLIPKSKLTLKPTPKLPTPKICKNCKFSIYKNPDTLCAFQKFKYNDEYNDDTFEYYLPAISCRLDEKICGISAKNYELK